MVSLKGRACVREGAYVREMQEGAEHKTKQDKEE